jgi:hypothetical protein
MFIVSFFYKETKKDLTAAPLHEKRRGKFSMRKNYLCYMIIHPTIFDSSKIIAAQSTRLGGISPAPFSSMNLGMSVNDTKENVLENRKLFFEGLGIKLDQLAISKQVHENNVQVVTEPIMEGDYYYDCIINEVKQCKSFVCFDPWSLKLEEKKVENEEV